MESRMMQVQPAEAENARLREENARLRAEIRELRLENMLNVRVIAQHMQQVREHARETIRRLEDRKLKTRWTRMCKSVAGMQQELHDKWMQVPTAARCIAYLTASYLAAVHIAMWIREAWSWWIR